jgi:hypothetical protein
MDVGFLQERNLAEVAACTGNETLYLELFDAATGDIIGRVIDQREDRDSGFGQRANRVTNKADADRIIRGWAETLRKALDNAHEVGK